MRFEHFPLMMTIRPEYCCHSSTGASKAHLSISVTCRLGVLYHIHEILLLSIVQISLVDVSQLLS